MTKSKNVFSMEPIGQKKKYRGARKICGEVKDRDEEYGVSCRRRWQDGKLDEWWQDEKLDEFVEGLCFFWRGGGVEAAAKNVSHHLHL